MSANTAYASAPIHRLFKIAVWAGAEAAVRLHIERGDDTNARDESGLTPLMIAAERNKAVVCQMLVDAGADLYALDPSGRTALKIAVANDAQEAAAVIELALSQQPLFVGLRTGVSRVSPDSTPAQMAIDGVAEGAGVFALATKNGLEIAALASLTSTLLQIPPKSAASSSVLIGSPTQLDFADDGGPLDLSGWEAEEESTPPIDDRSVAIVHVATQGAIGRHVASDDSADWAEFEAELPFHAAPMLRAKEAEGRIEIRELLLRASREGSVPEHAVEVVCRDADGARNQATEALLGFVINDMGAESDERFECRTPFDSSKPFIDPDESADEAETVDEALAFLDNLRSRHNEPIRLYMREAQRTVLLSAVEEAELGREMDRAAEAAIDALSRWYAGIELLLRVIGSARRAERSINSILSSPREAAAPEDAAGIDDLAAAEAEPPIGTADSAAVYDGERREGESEGKLCPAAAHEEAYDAFGLAEELAALIGKREEGSEAPIRATLVSLSLRRSFLIELCDAAAEGSAEAVAYSLAIRSLMVPRDRMVQANLRLVISLAKRYIHSGVPMDDLIQDGNIGLVSAVDKFDWRRGFRFSTMATWWIRQHISRSIADSFLAIRLPVHVHEIAQRFPIEVEAFEKLSGRSPTIQQLAKLVGLDWRKVETLLRAASAPLPIESLDEEPAFEAARDPDPFEVISVRELCATLDEVLSELGARPEKIVRLRYGIGIDEPRTLEEVGVLFDVTRERIRQIESKALTKLKHPTRLARLARWSLDPDKDRTSEVPRQSDIGVGEVFAACPDAPFPHTSATRAPTVARTEGGNSLTPVERVLRQAALLNISVEHTTRCEETITWVRLTKAIDNRQRKLIRALVDLGFEYLPGKGYWR